MTAAEASRATYTPYKRKAGEGIEMTTAEVAPYIAKHAELSTDPNSFRDANDPDKRLDIKWILSANNAAGPAAINVPDHRLHISVIEGKGGLEAPVLHAHSYPEIFICIKGRYEIWWGNDGENVVELGTLDTFAVPAGLMRTVKNVTEGEGQIMVIYDNTDDPNAGIVVPQSVIDADQAAGRDI
jgi:quercetin dioxygenase-like cupin family protein